MIAWTTVVLVLIPLCFGDPMPKCDHPHPPFNCSKIITYSNCLSPGAVQDCKQTNQYVYWRLDRPLSWSQAQAACALIDNSNMVSIHDFDENSIVMSLRNARITNMEAWIGLQCTGNCDSSTYTWTDGTPVNYTKTITLSSSAMCANIYSSSNNWVYWNGGACDTLLLSVCKAKIQ